MVSVCQERILVVEDEDDIAVVLKARLQSAGYAVHTESYGSAAVSYAIEHQPDLVILDVKLPDLGGYEVCEELRKVYDRADLPVVMYTVMDGHNDDVRGFVSGANAYLSKECEPDRLLDTVEQLLQEPK